MTELLNCPFCGGEAALGTVRYCEKTVAENGWGQDTFHKVNCIRCGTDNCGIIGHGSSDEAAARWNTRQAAAPQGREALEADETRACEDTSIGGVTWHSSEEDGGPDVGISVYLGKDDRLWAGEISKRTFDEHCGPLLFDSDGGWFLVRYQGKDANLIAKFGDAVEAQEFIEQVATWLRPLEIEDVRKAFRSVDEQDWAHLFRYIPDSGHGRFWKEVFGEARAALAQAQEPGKDKR